MFDIAHWVQGYGAVTTYLILTGVIFAETGLFIGFFLPGDTLLFPAGLLASQGYLDIFWVCGLTFVAAVVGNCVGYFFGKHVGPRIFKKEDSIFFHKDHILRARSFYNKHGGKTIILSRFLPILRTFAPIVAGVSGMNFGLFTIYTIIGAIFWTIGVSLAGFYFGKYIPNIDTYIVPIILLAIAVPLLSSIYELVKSPDRRSRIKNKIFKRKPDINY